MMTHIRKLLFHNIIEKGLNRLKLREKIMGLFIFCVIIPLICIDGIIIQRIISEERKEQEFIAESMADSVENLFNEEIKGCQNIFSSVSQNYKIGEVLGARYSEVYDYYEQYYKLTDNYFFQTLVRFDNMQIKLYTSNNSVVSGGYVGRIDSIENTQWYKEFKDSGRALYFKCDFDESKGLTESKRRAYYIAKLNYNNNPYENFIRIDIDYGTLSRSLENLGHANQIYVCDNEKILFSNFGNNSLGVPFEIKDDFENVAFCKETSKLGNINKIVVIDDGWNAGDFLAENKFLILTIILFSVILPAFVLYVIDYSIVHRIEKLNNVFGKRINDELLAVDNPEGSDEIGNLMKNYNRMVEEVNRLIQIVYKDKLKEQEMNIAKQNAELLALHSQINPHFMFNALESIRMHSLIKGEKETAEMVEKLAIMERQYVDWGSDMVRISQEISSIEAYLILQKYRFGDRLMYELNIEDECENLQVPKLTIVTFVENACVHGMENKTSEVWVFVRVYREEGKIIIEVEDTGSGMDEDKICEINQKAKTIELDDIKNAGHVGIYNALLRLKMTMGDNYDFSIESEEGIGTIIQISIPENAREAEEEE